MLIEVAHAQYDTYGPPNDVTAQGCSCSVSIDQDQHKHNERAYVYT